MCGRFTLTETQADLAEKLQIDKIEELRARYNIAPSQPVLAVKAGPHNERRVDFFNWGLIPAWAKDITIGYKMINARAETAADKPAFRAAMRHRRCLIPTNGFYEWKRTAERKQPYIFAVDGGSLFAMAGLWEVWTSSDGSEIHSCSILTCAANPLMAEVHDRMPVILDPTDYDRWIDSTAQSAEPVRDLLKPFAAERMTKCPVSRRVNSTRNDDPGVLEPDPDDGLEQASLF